MGRIHTDKLMPGMVLAADVRDRSGRLLLGAGTELSDRHLKILRTWGVVEVEIAGSEEKESDPHSANAIDPGLWDAIEKEISPMFRYTDITHPAVRELMRMRIVREATHGKR